MISANRGTDVGADAWAVQATDACVLIDQANEIDTAVEDLSSEQSAACLEILLESQIWVLNCES